MMARVTLLLLGVAVAVVLGLALSRAVHRRHPEGPLDGAGREWINVEDLTGPAVTLVALMLAFMLVQTYNSFQRAETQAATEAGVVDAEYDASTLLPAADGDAIRGDLVCYARAVSEVEWDTMTDQEASPVVASWRSVLKSDIAAAADHDPDRLSLSGLVALETQLVATHDERVAETSPAIPRGITWMVEIAALLSIVLLIGFTWHLRPLVRLSLVVSVSVLLLLVVLGIRELDTPFSGVIAIPPDRMHETSATIEAGGAGADAPCDAQGAPTS